MSIAFTIVENAGIYYDGVKERRRKDRGRQDMGILQNVFRKRFHRDQGPTKDIIVGRLWDNNKHERRTCQLRIIRKATSTGGSASEFGHSDGSRQTGSSRAIHQQRDANT